MIPLVRGGLSVGIALEDRFIDGTDLDVNTFPAISAAGVAAIGGPVGPIDGSGLAISTLPAISAAGLAVA